MLITLRLITSSGVHLDQGVRWSDRFDGPDGCVLALCEPPPNLIEGWIYSDEFGVLRLQTVFFDHRETWGLILTPVHVTLLMGRA